MMLRSSTSSMRTSTIGMSPEIPYCQSPEAARVIARYLEVTGGAAAAAAERTQWTRADVEAFGLTGTIAQNDYQAVRAIRREVAELLTDMEEGLKNLDVGVAREAATRAKQLGQMLSAEAEVRVELAIKQVRESCKKIAAAGENGVAEIDRVTIARLTETRTAFLDMDEAQEVEAPTQQARTVDLETVAA